MFYRNALLKIKILISFLFALNIVIFPQSNLIKHELPKIEFNRSDFSEIKGQGNYYPLNDNDFWEYKVIDSTTFMGIEGLQYSSFRDVLGDTLLSNGLTYKIIKWEKCCNSIDQPPFYEFQRKDSGKVYIFYEGQDYLLYDFTMPVGSTYPSHFPGLNWYVNDKYILDDLFLNEIDFLLFDQNSRVVREILITEEFGLTYDEDLTLPYYQIKNFFGSIINNTTFSYPLAKGQLIDWNEFYPLHVGNLWIYDGHEGFLPYKRYVRIVKDTLMQDGNIYKMTEDIRAGNIPYPSKEIYFQRMDSSGVIWRYSSPYYWHKFSACVGDTFTTSNSDFYNRLIDKRYNELYYLVFPDIVSAGRLFIRNLGLYVSTIEWGGETLIGAVINGVAYGDTTISVVEGIGNNPGSTFQLYQNYPNPFNPETNIMYSINEPGYVNITVYDLLGRKIETLVDEYKNTGVYQVTYDAKNLASGNYIYSLKSDGYIISKILTIIK